MGATCDGKILDWEDKGGTGFVTEVPRLDRYLSVLIKIANTRKLMKRLTRVRDKEK